MNWQIRKSNDVYTDSDGEDVYVEFYVVTNGSKEFRSENDADLQWLCDFLSKHDSSTGSNG